MPTVTRGTKTSAGGGTAFADATTIVASEFNTDFDALVTAINALDSDNFATAAVAETRIDDISATAAAHDDTTTPGDSSSHTLPTTLSGEIQQLRYVAERQALGIAPTRVDGSGTGAAGWYDLPARAPNLIRNSTFSGGTAASGTTAPYSWNNLGTGTPTFTGSALSGANLSEGGGREVRIQAGSAAVAGITQNLLSLKASTRYLVVARARATTNAAHLTVTGADATSSFRNFDATTSSSSYVTLKGVFQTDSTPSTITIKLTTNGANGDDVRFAFCGVYECNADFISPSVPPIIVSNSSSDVAISNAGFTDLGVTAKVQIPVPGFFTLATLQVPFVRNASDCVVGIQLLEDVGGGGPVEVGYTEISLTGAGDKKHVVLMAATTGAGQAIGQEVIYTASARASAANGATARGAETVTGGGGTTPKRIQMFLQTMRNG